MTSDENGSPSSADSVRVRTLVNALDEYRQARERLLAVLGHSSNRDPLAEVAEHLVAALMGGKLAVNRVQKAWDVELPDGVKAQVKYLANAPGSAVWVNEHRVRRIDDVDWYVLVLVEAFTVVGVLAFPMNLAPIAAALGKRHPDQERKIEFTRANWLTIRSDSRRFRTLGMRVWLPPFEQESCRTRDQDD
ncbi:hypothetical protein [Amycolatopsis benzoatilytica]|uniref:hypothetical protein n=1 Tax=Amycolatopsis benzoatilytica TaxID=346045 RepID=UPI00038083AC|nr:hypothetical protein [Amycolatopsis benzoatilytica]